MWPEIEKVKAENRRELHIPAERIGDDGFDESLFELEGLNLLRISDSELTEVPDKIGRLKNLQNLLLYHNKIGRYPSPLNDLDKLKVLDLSYNRLALVPDEINQLASLTTLNLSNNDLESFPSVNRLTKLVVLDVSGNKLKEFPEIDIEGGGILSDLILKDNEITVIPEEIASIGHSLKLLNLENNQIKALPKTLAALPKLKDVQLKANPVSDKRLLKLINQCGTKQVLDYVKQHGTQSASSGPSKKASKSANKNSSAQEEPAVVAAVIPTKPSIVIRKFDDGKSLRIISTDAVKLVRPHIYCCVWRDVAFDAQSFKAFIQLQTKLHNSVCQKRELSTIATHDYDKVVKDAKMTIMYTAAPSKSIKLMPLGRLQTYTALKLYEELKEEAELQRKEKKRNVYTGLYKYLHLLDKQESFACLKDAAGTTISLPPLTNSENTRISADTKNILIEVTSSSNATACKAAMDALFSEVVEQGIGTVATAGVIVEQVRVLDEDSCLRNIYPSKVDLALPNATIIRE